MKLVRDAIQSMKGYVPGEQPQAGKFIKLNTNENPYPPSPRVLQAVKHVAEQALVRYPDPRATAFRMQAAELLGVEPDWILCGNGSDDILTIVTRACVGQGERLRLPFPSYVLYKTLAQIQGAGWEEVPFRQDWTLDPAFAQSADGLRLVFLPNPNSPSGTVLDSETIADLVQRLPCPLLIDEAYVDFADSHCVDLVRRFPQVMVSRSLSKSYALAGLRFGFLVAQPAMIQQLMKVKDSYNCDAISITAATAAVSDQSWLIENTRRVRATRQRLADRMRQLGFAVTDSHANFVWCVQSGRPLQPIYEQLKAQHVLVRYMNYPGWGEGLRVSVGTDDQTDVFLDLMKSIV